MFLSYDDFNVLYFQRANKFCKECQNLYLIYQTNFGGNIGLQLRYEFQSSKGKLPDARIVQIINLHIKIFNNARTNVKLAWQSINIIVYKFNNLSVCAQNMQVYTQENINEMLVEIDGYFSDYDDQEKYFWVLSNVPMPSPTSQLAGGKSFGVEKSVISIIDLFDGRKPSKLYHNYKTARYDVGFRPTLILDSQLVTCLRRYVSINEGDTNIEMDVSLQANIKSFLRFVIENNFDFNSFFYYMESLVKDTSGNFHETAAKDATAILKLHAMDEERFLKTGEIIVDQNLLQIYRDDYGGNNLEETARSRSNRMLHSIDNWLSLYEERAIYASLLKMAIIEKEFSNNGKRNDILGKLGNLREFMENELNAFLMLEYYLALFYFSGLTGTFIPTIQPNLNVEKAFTKFRATTWDIILLRIPAMQLRFDSDNYTDLGFIATIDSSFANLARQFVIGGIVPVPYNKKIDTNIFLYRSEKILQSIERKTLEQFEEFNEKMATYRISQKMYNRITGKIDRALDSAELDELVDSLRNRFKHLCRK